MAFSSSVKRQQYHVVFSHSVMWSVAAMLGGSNFHMDSSSSGISGMHWQCHANGSVPASLWLRGCYHPNLGVVGGQHCRTIGSTMRTRFDMIPVLLICSSIPYTDDPPPACIDCDHGGTACHGKQTLTQLVFPGCRYTQVVNVDLAELSGLQTICALSSSLVTTWHPSGVLVSLSIVLQCTHCLTVVGPNIT